MEFLVLGAIALLVGLLVGIPTGIFIGMERMRKAVERRSVGNLRIDRSEPDEPPRPFLEVTRGVTIESIAEEKFVILKVINENYLSHN
jgi:hypothetical protein